MHDMVVTLRKQTRGPRAWSGTILATGTVRECIHVQLGAR